MIKIVVAYASDWGVLSEQIERDEDIPVVRGWVVGELVKETKDALVIAHHSFDDGHIRHVTTMPKVNIETRRDFKAYAPNEDAPPEAG